MLRTILATACAFAIIFPSVARADALSDLEAMRAAFNAAKSWHAVEHLPDGRIITVDYAAPDRWRIVNPSMTELVIGGTVYMVHGGKTTPMPFLGGMVQKMLDGFRFAPYGADVKASARDLGMQAIGGKRLHAYSFTTNGTPVTMYIGSDHLPVQSQVQINHPKNGTMTIEYSGWNAPVSISP